MRKATNKDKQLKDRKAVLKLSLQVLQSLNQSFTTPALELLVQTFIRLFRTHPSLILFFVKHQGLKLVLSLKKGSQQVCGRLCLLYELVDSLFRH